MKDHGWFDGEKDIKLPTLDETILIVKDLYEIPIMKKYFFWPKIPEDDPMSNLYDMDHVRLEERIPDYLKQGTRGVYLGTYIRYLQFKSRAKFGLVNRSEDIFSNAMIVLRYFIPGKFEGNTPKFDRIDDPELYKYVARGQYRKYFEIRPEKVT